MAKKEKKEKKAKKEEEAEMQEAKPKKEKKRKAEPEEETPKKAKKEKKAKKVTSEEEQQEEKPKKDKKDKKEKKDKKKESAGELEQDTPAPKEESEDEDTMVIKNKDTKMAAQVAACTSTKCFFGNLSFKIDDDSFKAEVEPKIGKVVSIQWMTDRETQQFRGSGIIEFTSTDDAGKAALLEGEGFEIMGRPVRTRLWEERAKADRPVRENKLSERPENCTTVFAGNLSYDIDDDKMAAFFKDAGEVKQIRWLTNKETGEFRGCGFVEFYDTDGVDKAILKNGESLLGRNVRLDYSAPRPPREY